MKLGVITGMAALAAVMVPAAGFARDAQSAPRGEASRGMDDAVRTLESLSDPRLQKDMGNLLSALVGSLMNLRVGEIANAAQNMDMPGTSSKKMVRRAVRKINPDATLADLMGKGDPDFADKLDDDVRMMPKMAGTMAGSLAKMLPMIDAMARDLEAQIGDDLKAAKPRR